MATRSTAMTAMQRLAALATMMAPGLALAHGTDHLHFWGHHTADGQVISMALALLALMGIGWWLLRSGR